MAIQGILFDLDGTLINSNELIFQSFEYALDTILHTSVSREQLTLTFGQPLRQIMDELGGAQSDLLRQAFADYTLAHEDQLSLFPGVEETLRQLKALHIGMALVTSRLYSGAKRDLDQFHLAHYFDVFITPESTKQHKPHPEPAQKALAALHLSPQQAIFVGDSSHDLQCGKAAGCKTAAVRYSLFQPEELLQCQPDYMLGTLLDLLPIIDASAPSD